MGEVSVVSCSVGHCTAVIMFYCEDAMFEMPDAVVGFPVSAPGIEYVGTLDEATVGVDEPSCTLTRGTAESSNALVLVVTSTHTSLEWTWSMAGERCTIDV